MSEDHQFPVSADIPASLEDGAPPAPSAPAPVDPAPVDVTKLPLNLPPSVAPVAPVRPILRQLTAAQPDPAAEDLNPAAPDPFAVPGETLAEEPDTSRLMELAHVGVPEAPLPKPAEDYVSSHVVFRLSVVLPIGDPRIPSMDLLMNRAKAVLAGEYLTPAEQLAGHFGPKLRGKSTGLRTAQQLAEQRREKLGRAGRPRIGRRGIITTATGDEFAFDTLLDCAAQLKAAYTNISNKYRKACAEAGVDPDDNDGVTFKYKEDTITVRTR